MTTENTWRRWVMFADWCCFTDRTADTDHSVILDASLVFLFVCFFLTIIRRWILFQGNFQCCAFMIFSGLPDVCIFCARNKRMFLGRKKQKFLGEKKRDLCNKSLSEWNRALKMSEQSHFLDIYSNSKSTCFHGISAGQLWVPSLGIWYWILIFVYTTFNYHRLFWH